LERIALEYKSETMLLSWLACLAAHARREDY
jgi:hypothetical protein